MADTGRTVWADGLWADDFWAEGFWSTQDAVPEPEPTGPTPAGRSRRKRYFVQIDGRDFEVASAQEAVQVLRKAAALAEVAAEKQAAEVKTKPQAKVKPVRLAVPEVRTNAPVDITPYARAIEKAYRNAQVAAELRLLLDAQMREDDEMAAYLLLN